MVTVGIWLVATGTADVVADLTGKPANARRIGAAVLLTGLMSALMAWGLGFTATNVAALTSLSMVSSAVWLAVRWTRRDNWSPKQAATGLAVFGALLALWIGLSGRWPQVDGGVLGRWLRDLSLDRLSELPVDQAVVLAGSFLALVATANALVRLLLASVGTNPLEGEQRLRGGRIIGPMERALILGFVVAGAPTAAALVVSAKSLLRFPEISSAKGTTLSEITEYFLVGSLSSWLLALGASLLIEL